jgi:hypothetical protein
MSATVFAFGKKDGELGPWHDKQAEFLAEGLTKLSGRGPIKIKEKGPRSQYGPERKPKDGLQRTLAILEHDRDLQHTVFIRDAKSTLWVARIGVLHYEPPDPPGNISPAIRDVHDFIFTRCEELQERLNRELRVVTMGYTVNKWINGTVGGTPSQHCDGPPSPDGGNAVDFVIRGKDGRNDIMATDIIVNDLETKRFVDHVLWRGVANHYPGHAHVSGRPLRRGIPAALR